MGQEGISWAAPTCHNLGAHQKVDPDPWGLGRNYNSARNGTEQTVATSWDLLPHSSSDIGCHRYYRDSMLFSIYFTRLRAPIVKPVEAKPCHYMPSSLDLWSGVDTDHREEVIWIKEGAETASEVVPSRSTAERKWHDDMENLQSNRAGDL